MQENKKDEFDFIKEKIKDKPLNKKRLMQHVIFTVALAVLFGFIACFIITIMQPVMEKWFIPQEDPTISFPQDVVTEDTEVESTEDGTEQAPVYITETQELEVSDYQSLQNKLYAIGEQANKSIVTVTGVKSDTDIFNSAYESEGQASGVIVANNGQELLIMTEKKVIADAQNIQVTFFNDDIVSAVLKKYDGNTGIAILSVILSDISDETLQDITVATLGNSYTVTPGTVTIAVGSPLGYNFSILAGDITSSSESVSTLDATYQIFTTDIVASNSGSGVLINLNGEVIGFIMQGYSNSGDENTLTAVSISDLKEVMEKLSNNQDIPYLGVKANTVTNEISAQYDLPKGVYIKSVEMDSPAMNAGLQSGDIIVEMDGTSIVDVDDYTEKLLSTETGKTMSITVKRLGTDGYTKITCTPTVGVLQ